MKIHIIFLSMMMFVSGALLAQVSNGQPQVPPGFIDGAKNPDLVPDMVAYRLVFLSLAGQSAEIQDLKLKRFLLTEVDKNALKQILWKFDQQYIAWRRESKQMRATKAQAFEIVQYARNLLNQSLTPDGVTKFTVFVEKAKSRMIVRP